MAKNKETKTSLTAKEAISAIYTSEIMGANNAQIAAALGVSNQGRVAEVIKAMRWAAHHVDDLYDVSCGRMTLTPVEGD